MKDMQFRVTVRAPDGEASSEIARLITRALDADYGVTVEAGAWFSEEDLDEAAVLRGEDFTEGAGPDATCGCGETITYYEGTWLHIVNPELRGTDDHDAEPDGPVDWGEEGE